MPALIVERRILRREIREALKRHILRERQKRKAEANANEACKQRRREEKAQALSSSKVQLERNIKDILELERRLVDLQQKKTEQCDLLRRALIEEDRRKHSQAALNKEPSWSSLYSPYSHMVTYPHHSQHYPSVQLSHRLIAYERQNQQQQLLSQQNQFISATASANVNSKRSLSPSSHMYSPPPSKSIRTAFVSPNHTRTPSPAPLYQSPSNPPLAIHRSHGFPPSQSQPALPAFIGYMPQSTAKHSTSSFVHPISHIPGPLQMSNYINPLSYAPHAISDPKQQTKNTYSHHGLYMKPKNGSITHGYPLQT